jgi:DNA-binding response OmpR family regulator
LREIRQLEATRGLSLQRRIPAIALTGYGQTENRVRALSTGFRLHMTKPAAITELIASIRKFGRPRPGQLMCAPGRRERHVLGFMGSSSNLYVDGPLDSLFLIHV